VKYSQTATQKQAINDMQVVTGQIPAEQFVDIIQSTLTADL
jgi:hypothetical protein